MHFDWLLKTNVFLTIWFGKFKLVTKGHEEKSQIIKRHEFRDWFLALSTVQKTADDDDIYNILCNTCENHYINTVKLTLK